MPRHDLVENLVHKQHLAELSRHLDKLHSADIAYLLEALPLDERLFVWDLVKAERDGDILLEVSDAVRESPDRDHGAGGAPGRRRTARCRRARRPAPDLPEEVMEDVYLSLDLEERAQLRAAMSHPEDTVGALMDFEQVSVREDVTLEVVLRYLRRFEALPDHTDKLFVVDRKDRLRGVLPVNRLLVNDPEVEVSAVMVTDAVRLHPEDKAEDAAGAFERYDLISAPVVTSDNRLMGRVTVADVVDYIREESEAELLSQAGLRERRKTSSRRCSIR